MESYLSPTITKAVEMASKHIDGYERNIYLLASTFGQNAKNLNMSDIYSRLIQEAGRWTLNYASDILYDIKEISDYIKDPKAETAYFPIGVRRNGVDGYNFIISRLLDTRSGLHPYVYSEHIYNSLMAVKITSTPDRISVELWDIIHDLTTIHESDLPENRKE